jgi:hypothetical protein
MGHCLLRHGAVDHADVVAVNPPLLWILNKNHEPVPAQDVIEWAKWFEVPKNRVVMQDQVGDQTVSTVFNGTAGLFNENTSDRPHPPNMFETAVFEKCDVLKTQRCDTWNDAVYMHMEIVTRLRRKMS